MVPKVVTQTGAGSGELLAAAAHELKTPLTIMTSIAAATRGGLFGRVSQPMAMQLGRIELTGNRLLGVVDGLLNLEKYRSGITPLEREPVDIVTVARGVTDELRSLAQDGQQVISIHAVHGVPPAYANRYFLHQILFNLIHNALKYSPQKSHIDVYIRRDHDMVCITVTDRAAPLRGADKRHIFTKFSPLTSRQNIPGSNGLGLYLCRNLTQLLDGRLTHRALRTGNRFYVRVPSIEQLALFESGL